MRAHRGHDSAFTLAEVLVYLAVFVVVLGMTGPLLKKGIDTGRTAGRVTRTVAAAETALGMIRSDLRSAASVRLPPADNGPDALPPGAVLLVYFHDGARAAYELQDGVLVRHGLADGAPPWRTEDAPDGAVVAVGAGFQSVTVSPLAGARRTYRLEATLSLDEPAARKAAGAGRVASFTTAVHVRSEGLNERP